MCVGKIDKITFGGAKLLSSTAVDALMFSNSLIGIYHV